MTEYRHITSIFISPVFPRGGVNLYYIITCKRLLLHLRVRRLFRRIPLLTFENRKSYIMKKETYATPYTEEIRILTYGAFLNMSVPKATIEVSEEDDWDSVEGLDS